MKIYHILIDKGNGCSPLSAVDVEKSFLSEEAAFEYIDDNPEIFEDYEADYSIVYSYIDAELK